MINFTDSIDVTIFMAMQISKKCLDLGDNCPILFLSNPGIGKSTAVELFAEVNGYDVILLRLSNENPETLTGFPVIQDTKNTNAVIVQNDTLVETKNTCAPWFKRILDNTEKGITSVLFLDEITTANTSVQGAALNLVFDRKYQDKKLPDDTLIVAAGNYAQNLTSDMTILPPMLNRFAIINLTCKIGDIDHFLCKYDGSLAGNKIDFKEEVRKSMNKLKNQEKKDLEPKFINIIGELLQNSIKQEFKMIWKEGLLDPNVQDLKDIYNTSEDDSPVSNFYSYRSMNYLLNYAVACYICFGKEGLLSDNFKKMIQGTVGLCLSRDPKSHDVKKNIVTERVFETIAEVANDIEKLSDKKLPKYREFFVDIIKSKNKLEVPEINLITKKLQDMMNDKDLSNIERPIEHQIITDIFTKLLGTLKENSYNNIDFDKAETAIQDELTRSPQTYAGYVNAWNSVANLATEIEKLVRDPKNKYARETKDYLNNFQSRCREYSHQLKLIRRIFKKLDEALCETIPQLTPIQSSSK